MTAWENAEPTGGKYHPVTGKPDDTGAAITGWRVWRIREGQLISLSNQTRWNPARALAVGSDHRQETRIASLALAVAITYGAVEALAWLITRPPTGTSWPLPALEMLAIQLDIGWIIPGMKWITPGLILALSVSNRNELITICRNLLGQKVHPGEKTPGIYALYEPKELVADREEVARGIVVMGTVQLWGDTIEHDQGIKAEYAYPQRIEAVACSSCREWMPLATYEDEGQQPRHPSCPEIVRLDEDGNPIQWIRPGLSDLRAAAPHWFQ